MAYCTLADVRSYLGFASADTADDTLISACIRRAQATIDLLAGCHFEAVTETRYFDAVRDVDSDGMLRFDAPLLSVSSITNGDSDVLASTEYVLYPANDTPKYGVKMLASKGLQWTYTDDPENAITVVATWGQYTTAPEDIAQACIRLAAYYYRQKDAQVFDVTAQPDMGVITVPQGIPRDVRLIVNAYKRMM